MDLVYGEIDDGMVFIERNKAEELECLHQGLRGSVWSDLKAAVTEARWREILERLGGDEVELNGGLDSHRIRGYSDGDWPEWPAREMLEWMPRDVADQFGRVDDSVFNGAFLVLDPDHATEIVEALERLGWSCEEDEALVVAASGYD